MPKSADAFRTISEVADWLGVQPHVLRFWESKFAQVKPIKRAGGRRYYRPADMLLLGGIKKLLHDDGMTIKGVQKLLRESGVAFVSDQSQALDDLTMAVIDGQSTPAPATPPAPRKPEAEAAGPPVAQTDDATAPEPVAPESDEPPDAAEAPAEHIETGRTEDTLETGAARAAGSTKPDLPEPATAEDAPADSDLATGSQTDEPVLQVDPAEDTVAADEPLEEEEQAPETEGADTPTVDEVVTADAATDDEVGVQLEKPAPEETVQADDAETVDTLEDPEEQIAGPGAEDKQERSSEGSAPVDTPEEIWAAGNEPLESATEAVDAAAGDKPEIGGDEAQTEAKSATWSPDISEESLAGTAGTSEDAATATVPPEEDAPAPALPSFRDRRNEISPSESKPGEAASAEDPASSLPKDSVADEEETEGAEAEPDDSGPFRVNVPEMPAEPPKPAVIEVDLPDVAALPAAAGPLSTLARRPTFDATKKAALRPLLARLKSHRDALAAIDTEARKD